MDALVILDKCIIECCCGNEFSAAGSYPAVRADNSSASVGALVKNDGTEPKALEVDELTKVVGQLLKRDGKGNNIKSKRQVQ